MIKIFCVYDEFLSSWFYMDSSEEELLVKEGLNSLGQKAWSTLSRAARGITSNTYLLIRMSQALLDSLYS